MEYELDDRGKLRPSESYVSQRRQSKAEWKVAGVKSEKILQGMPPLTLEKQIPMPDPKGNSPGELADPQFAALFPNMEVGDSFFVPMKFEGDDEKVNRRTRDKIRGKITYTFLHWRRVVNRPEMKLGTRTVGGGLRIWRTA